MTRLWWLAAFFTVALVRSMTDGIGLVDESWFLQVVARVRAGDVLTVTCSSAPRRSRCG